MIHLIKLCKHNHFTICEVSKDTIILFSLTGHSTPPDTLVPPKIKYFNQ